MFLVQIRCKLEIIRGTTELSELSSRVHKIVVSLNMPQISLHVMQDSVKYILFL